MRVPLQAADGEQPLGFWIPRCLELGQPTTGLIVVRQYMRCRHWHLDIVADVSPKRVHRKGNSQGFQRRGRRVVRRGQGKNLFIVPSHRRYSHRTISGFILNHCGESNHTTTIAGPFSSPSIVDVTAGTLQTKIKGCREGGRGENLMFIKTPVNNTGS